MPTFCHKSMPHFEREIFILEVFCEFRKYLNQNRCSALDSFIATCNFNFFFLLHLWFYFFGLMLLCYTPQSNFLLYFHLQSRILQLDSHRCAIVEEGKKSHQKNLNLVARLQLSCKSNNNNFLLLFPLL